MDYLNSEGIRCTMSFALMSSPYQGSPVKDLQSAIQADRALQPQPIVSLAADVAAGLLHLHTNGIVHGNPDLSHMLAMVTGKGDIATGLGVPRAAALESLQFGRFSTATDVFHFGMSLVEMLTGGSWETGWPASESGPVDNELRLVRLRAAIQSGFNDVKSNLAPWCPRAFGDLLLDCLVVNPLKRPQMSYVAAQLRLIANDPKALVVQPQAPAPKPEPTHASAAAHQQFWMHSAHICLELTVDDTLIRAGGVWECLYGKAVTDEIRKNYNPTTSRCKTSSVRAAALFLLVLQQKSIQ
jgi:serine/threonine protein kinase